MRLNIRGANEADVGNSRQSSKRPFSWDRYRQISGNLQIEDLREISDINLEVETLMGP